MKKLRTVVMGATGAAGQNIVESLMGHPWFELKSVAASKRSAGKTYREAIEGAVFFEEAPSDDILGMRVRNVDEIKPGDYDIAFSALPASVAKGLEARFAQHIPVMSTASAYRYEDDVPVLIPEVNPEHAKLIDVQRERRGWGGFICPGPNCTTVGLAMTLKPIHDAFTISTVNMVSLQALSGAGEKGLRVDSPYRKQVEMNVYPFIDQEEEKVTIEANKILGNLEGDRVKEASIGFHSTCTRVYVDTVHTEVVNLSTVRPNTIEEIREVLEGFRGEPQELGLPSAPEQPIMVLDEVDMPQPRRHREFPDMVTLVGRLRRNPTLENGVSYILTSDNLERGAGWGAVNNAEFLKVKGYI